MRSVRGASSAVGSRESPRLHSMRAGTFQPSALGVLHRYGMKAQSLPLTRRLTGLGTHECR
jgi:hypothetical protein